MHISGQPIRPRGRRTPQPGFLWGFFFPYALLASDSPVKASRSKADGTATESSTDRRCLTTARWRIRRGFFYKRKFSLTPRPSGGRDRVVPDFYRLKFYGGLIPEVIK